jgi:hypothetical protein
MSMSNTEKHVKDIRRKTRSIEGVSSSPFLYVVSPYGTTGTKF